MHKVGAEKWDGPRLAVQYIDVEGPLNPIWPPESHRRIFGDLAAADDSGITIAGTAPRSSLIGRWSMPSESSRRSRAESFRRTVTALLDVAPFVAIVQAKLAEGYAFEPAVRRMP